MAHNMNPCGRSGGGRWFNMWETVPTAAIAPEVPSTPLNINSRTIERVILDAGMVNYVAATLRHNSLQPKCVVRGYRQLADDGPNLPEDRGHGPDHYVLSQLMAELDSYYLDYVVVGWGRMFLDSRSRKVTVYENIIQSTVDSTVINRLIWNSINEWKVENGYHLL